MPLIAEGRHQMILGTAGGRGESLMTALRRGRSKEGVVLDIELQHRHPRVPAEIRGRFDQSVGAQLLFGLPSTRPTAKVMIALTRGGFTLDSAMEAQPPADCPTTRSGERVFSATM